jgi:cobalamin-dependent methionine synthase I
MHQGRNGLWYRHASELDVYDSIPPIYCNLLRIWFLNRREDATERCLIYAAHHHDTKSRIKKKRMASKTGQGKIELFTRQRITDFIEEDDEEWPERLPIGTRRH